MKKSYKIEVDCANCANLVEEALKNVPGIKNVVISFMTQRMKIEFDEDAQEDAVLDEAKKTAKRIEPDFEIF